jgi:hypothetical protein
MPVKQLHLLPFRRCHDVVVVAADDMRIHPYGTQKFCVQVGVVGDVADVQNPKRTIVPIFKGTQPFHAVCRDHGEDRGTPLRLVPPLPVQLSLSGSAYDIVKGASNDEQVDQRQYGGSEIRASS